MNVSKRECTMKDTHCIMHEQVETEAEMAEKANLGGNIDLQTLGMSEATGNGTILAAHTDNSNGEERTDRQTSTETMKLDIIDTYSPTNKIIIIDVEEKVKNKEPVVSEVKYHPVKIIDETKNEDHHSLNMDGEVYTDTVGTTHRQTTCTIGNDERVNQQIANEIITPYTDNETYVENAEQHVLNGTEVSRETNNMDSVEKHASTVLTQISTEDVSSTSEGTNTKTRRRALEPVLSGKGSFARADMSTQSEVTGHCEVSITGSDEIAGNSDEENIEPARFDDIIDAPRSTFESYTPAHEATDEESGTTKGNIYQRGSDSIQEDRTRPQSPKTEVDDSTEEYCYWNDSCSDTDECADENPSDIGDISPEDTCIIKKKEENDTFENYLQFAFLWGRLVEKWPYLLAATQPYVDAEKITYTNITNDDSRKPKERPCKGHGAVRFTSVAKLEKTCVSKTRSDNSDYEETRGDFKIIESAKVSGNVEGKVMLNVRTWTPCWITVSSKNFYDVISGRECGLLHNGNLGLKCITYSRIVLNNTRTKLPFGKQCDAIVPIMEDEGQLITDDVIRRNVSDILGEKQEAKSVASRHTFVRQPVICDPIVNEISLYIDRNQCSFISDQHVAPTVVPTRLSTLSPEVIGCISNDLIVDKFVTPIPDDHSQKEACQTAAVQTASRGFSRTYASVSLQVGFISGLNATIVNSSHRYQITDVRLNLTNRTCTQGIDYYDALQRETKIVRSNISVFLGERQQAKCVANRHTFVRQSVICDLIVNEISLYIDGNHCSSTTDLHVALTVRIAWLSTPSLEVIGCISNVVIVNRFVKPILDKFQKETHQTAVMKTVNIVRHRFSGNERPCYDEFQHVTQARISITIPVIRNRVQLNVINIEFDIESEVASGNLILSTKLCSFAVQEEVTRSPLCLHMNPLFEVFDLRHQVGEPTTCVITFWMDNMVHISTTCTTVYLLLSGYNSRKHTVDLLDCHVELSVLVTEKLGIATSTFHGGDEFTHNKPNKEHRTEISHFNECHEGQNTDHRQANKIGICQINDDSQNIDGNAHVVTDLHRYITRSVRNDHKDRNHYSVGIDNGFSENNIDATNLFPEGNHEYSEMLQPGEIHGSVSSLEVPDGSDMKSSTNRHADTQRKRQVSGYSRHIDDDGTTNTNYVNSAHQDIALYGESQPDKTDRGMEDNHSRHDAETDAVTHTIKSESSTVHVHLLGEARLNLQSGDNNEVFCAGQMNHADIQISKTTNDTTWHQGKMYAAYRRRKKTTLIKLHIDNAILQTGNGLLHPKLQCLDNTFKDCVHSRRYYCDCMAIRGMQAVILNYPEIQLYVTGQITVQCGQENASFIINQDRTIEDIQSIAREFNAIQTATAGQVSVNVRFKLSDRLLSKIHAGERPSQILDQREERIDDDRTDHYPESRENLSLGTIVPIEFDDRTAHYSGTCENLSLGATVPIEYDNFENTLDSHNNELHLQRSNINTGHLLNELIGGEADLECDITPVFDELDDVNVASLRYELGLQMENLKDVGMMTGPGDETRRVNNDLTTNAACRQTRNVTFDNKRQASRTEVGTSGTQCENVSNTQAANLQTDVEYSRCSCTDCLLARHAVQTLVEHSLATLFGAGLRCVHESIHGSCTFTLDTEEIEEAFAPANDVKNAIRCKILQSLQGLEVYDGVYVDESNDVGVEITLCRFV